MPHLAAAKKFLERLALRHATSDLGLSEGLKIVKSLDIGDAECEEARTHIRNLSALASEENKLIFDALVAVHNLEKDNFINLFFEKLVCPETFEKPAGRDRAYIFYCYLKRNKINNNYCDAFEAANKAYISKRLLTTADSAAILIQQEILSLNASCAKEIRYDHWRDCLAAANLAGKKELVAAIEKGLASAKKQVYYHDLIENPVLRELVKGQILKVKGKSFAHAIFFRGTKSIIAEINAAMTVPMEREGYDALLKSINITSLKEADFERVIAVNANPPIEKLKLDAFKAVYTKLRKTRFQSNFLNKLVGNSAQQYEVVESHAKKKNSRSAKVFKKNEQITEEFNRLGIGKVSAEPNKVLAAQLGAYEAIYKTLRAIQFGPWTNYVDDKLKDLSDVNKAARILTHITIDPTCRSAIAWQLATNYLETLKVKGAEIANQTLIKAINGKGFVFSSEEKVEDLLKAANLVVDDALSKPLTEQTVNPDAQDKTTTDTESQKQAISVDEITVNSAFKQGFLDGLVPSGTDTLLGCRNTIVTDSSDKGRLVTTELSDKTQDTVDTVLQDAEQRSKCLDEFFENSEEEVFKVKSDTSELIDFNEETGPKAFAPVGSTGSVMLSVESLDSQFANSVDLQPVPCLVEYEFDNDV